MDQEILICNTKRDLTEKDLGEIFYPKNRMKEYGIKNCR